MKILPAVDQNSASRIAPELNHTDDTVVDMVLQAINQLRAVGLTVDHDVTRGCTTAHIRISDGMTEIYGQAQRQLNFSCVVNLERVAELKFCEQRLNTLLSRMAAVGWRVNLTEDDNERFLRRGYIDRGAAEPRDFCLTYDDIYAIEEELIVAEARRYLLQHSHLPGFHEKFELGAAKFRLANKVTAMDYTLETAKNAIKTAFPLTDDNPFSLDTDNIP